MLMETGKVYKVKGVTGWLPLVTQLLAGTSLLINVTMIELPDILRYIIYGLLGVILIFTLYIIAELVKSPFMVQFNDDYLSINNHKVQASEIGKVYIYGKNKVNVGIRLVGGRMISQRLSFRFLQDKDQGMKEMAEWASRQGIELENNHRTRTTVPPNPPGMHG